MRFIRQFHNPLVYILLVAAALSGFLIYWNFGHIAMAKESILLTEAQTAALMSVVFVHVGYVMTARSTFGSAFTFSSFSNRWILGGVALTIIRSMMIVYVPFMNSIFRTAPFPTEWWLLIFIGLPVGFLVLELEKLVRRQLRKRKARL